MKRSKEKIKHYLLSYVEGNCPSLALMIAYPTPPSSDRDASKLHPPPHLPPSPHTFHQVFVYVPEWWGGGWPYESKVSCLIVRVRLEVLSSLYTGIYVVWETIKIIFTEKICFGLWLQVLYKHGISAGILPSIPYAEILTYSFSTALLFHAVRNTS